MSLFAYSLPSLHEIAGDDQIILEMSLGGDGTGCPPPDRPLQNCSMMMYSKDVRDDSNSCSHLWYVDMHTFFAG